MWVGVTSPPCPTLPDNVGLRSEPLDHQGDQVVDIPEAVALSTNFRTEHDGADIRFQLICIKLGLPIHRKQDPPLVLGGAD